MPRPVLPAVDRLARTPRRGTSRPRPGGAGRRGALLALTLALSACQLFNGPAPAAVTAASGTPSPTLPGNCGLAETPAQVLAKLNDYRSVGGRCGGTGRHGAAPPLSWQPGLAQLAAAHSRDMADQARLSHAGGGRSLTQRLDAAGYAWQAAAENVAAGQPRLALVLADWVSSPPHCANLMSPTYSDAGLACQRSGDGTPYWTLILARPR
jgi:uncharacterized protein YkwD